MNTQTANYSTDAPLMWPAAATAPAEVNPDELQALRAAVAPARTFYGCLRTLLASAVTTAAIVLGQDWSQEAEHELRREEQGHLTVNR